MNLLPVRTGLFGFLLCASLAFGDGFWKHDGSHVEIKVPCGGEKGEDCPKARERVTIGNDIVILSQDFFEGGAAIVGSKKTGKYETLPLKVSVSPKEEYVVAFCAGEAYCEAEVVLIDIRMGTPQVVYKSYLKEWSPQSVVFKDGKIFVKGNFWNDGGKECVFHFANPSGKKWSLVKFEN